MLNNNLFQIYYQIWNFWPTQTTEQSVQFRNSAEQLLVS